MSCRLQLFIQIVKLQVDCNNIFIADFQIKLALLNGNLPNCKLDQVFAFARILFDLDAVAIDTSGVQREPIGMPSCLERPLDRCQIITLP
ncbi:hypothetical protein QR78_25755 [Methylobacterium indicum]|uniref:Uncharacterized protein n=1 Tax=Methylobacterium indicum TaxID=1775910 RepID=A0ABR5GQD2_9HYPH|nr:hypothetical protein QR79_30230 [Methylobacterium indicum]KMO13170.1 hypothetical protein QR78_25755 [Methylobacterium indicum]